MTKSTREDKNKKTRVQVTLGSKTLEMLDAYCERTGMTRSGYIAYVTSSSLDTAAQLLSATGDSLRRVGEHDENE